MCQSNNMHDHGKNINFCFKRYQLTNNFYYVFPRMFTPDRILTISYGTILPSFDRIDGEYQYLDLVRSIIERGIYKQTRNAITKSIFGYQMKYNLADGYPISTLKKSYPKAIFEELMWMIRGQTNVKILQEKNVNIWNKNSSKEFLQQMKLPYEEGDIGPGYGFQMRYYGAKYVNCLADYRGQGVDQLQQCIDLINNDPHSRRIIIDLWNPADVPLMVLPCCHCWYNFSVDLYDSSINDPNGGPEALLNSCEGKRGKLNCHLIQRSWDVLLGWNTTTAALFTYLLAHHCNLDLGLLVHSISDAHLYKEHIDSGAVAKLLARTPRKMPSLDIVNTRASIEDYEFTDMVIENYYPCPPITAEMIA